MDPGRFLLRFLSSHERGEHFRKISEVMTPGIAFLFSFDRLPLFDDTIGITNFTRAENMGMPANKFGNHSLQYINDIKTSGFGGDLRVHDCQEDDVPKLFLQVLII